jgi:hypothetical protein
MHENNQNHHIIHYKEAGKVGQTGVDHGQGQQRTDVTIDKRDPSPTLLEKKYREAFEELMRAQLGHLVALYEIRHRPSRMAPYDSDSSAGEEEDFTETNVLLGYASKDADDDTISRVGGRPVRPMIRPISSASCRNAA